MNWNDYEFIRDVPSEAASWKEEITFAELTGWEAIIFELKDEEDEE